MIIFGSRTKAVWTGQEPTDVPCDSCARLALRPHVFQRYAHVFWIPMFPIDEGDIAKKGYFTPESVALDRAKLVTWQADGGLRAVIRE